LIHFYKRNYTIDVSTIRRQQAGGGRSGGSSGRSPGGKIF